MSDFAQNFIAGFMAGHRAKSDRARLDLDKEEQDSQRTNRESHLKLLQEREKAEAGVRSNLLALELVKNRAATPTPLQQDNPYGEAQSISAPGGGPPAPQQEEPLFLTDPVSGGKTQLGAPHLEDVVRQKLMQMTQEAQVKDDLENVPLTSDLPQIGLKAGTRVRPNELSAKVQLRGQDTALEASRIRASLAGKGGMDINDPAIKGAVDNAADRVAAGEISIGDARGLLGGVKGGLGTHLLTALGERRALPTKVRVELGTLNQARASIQQVEGMVRDVQEAKTAKDRVENSLLLEQYIKANATNLAKGYGGEIGRVTDQDAVRVLGIFPGWKAANFAPGYVEKELKAMRSGIDKREKAITTGYFAEVDKAGNKSKTPEDEANEYLNSLGGN